MDNYDLVVVGSGPGGEKAAIQAAKLGKRVLVVERGERLGGASMHTGSIPSKTLRESVRYISLMKMRPVFGISLALAEDLTLDRLMHRKREAINSLVERQERNFERNGIAVAQGEASFLDAHRLRIRGHDKREREVEAGHVVLAVGTRPYHPEWLDFTDPRVRDSDTILGLHEIPRSITIIGAGVIGCEYATMFIHLGTRVNLVNPRVQLLDFLDEEMSSSLAFLMREAGVRIRLGESLSSVSFKNGSVYAEMESGKVLKSEYLFFANGRTGNTEELNLPEIDITVNDRQQIPVNRHYQSSQPHIYAVGDVIGMPSLATTAMDQGRLAALHAFGGEEGEKTPFSLLPVGIYTLPEISMIGATEEELTRDRVPYEVGSATFREIARGQIQGNTTGRLKILFHRESLALLGVHIIGTSATDLIHIGQAVMAFKGTVEYFMDNAFNYPTFSEAYRVAALNGLNRL